MVDNGTLVLYYMGSELKVGSAITEMGTYRHDRTIQVYRLERNWQHDDPSAYVRDSFVYFVVMI